MRSSLLSVWGLDVNQGEQGLGCAWEHVKKRLIDSGTMGAWNSSTDRECWRRLKFQIRVAYIQCWGEVLTNEAEGLHRLVEITICTASIDCRFEFAYAVLRQICSAEITRADEEWELWSSWGKDDWMPGTQKGETYGHWQRERDWPYISRATRVELQVLTNSLKIHSL